MRWCASFAIGTVLVLGSVAACGADDDAGTPDRPRLVVFAAASMTEPLRSCSRRFEDAEVRLSLGGSDRLAAQMRQGVEPDVYAAADTGLPEALNREGLLERPVRFATNELAVAVPRDSPVRSIEQLARADASLAVGSRSVPIGVHARRLFERLPGRLGDALLGKVRSEEPDVRGVVGKLTQGGVDAGVVYRTDVLGAGGRLRAIRLPPGAGRPVVYAAGAGSGARQPHHARAYVRGLARGGCGRALRAAGFGAPP